MQGIRQFIICVENQLIFKNYKKENMGQWTDRIQNHPVWLILDSIEPLLDNILQRDSLPIDNAETTIEAIERVRTANIFIRRRLTSTDPILLFPAALTALQTPLKTVQANLEAYLANPDFAYLTAANDQTDIALHSVNMVVGTKAVDDLTALSKATSDYRSTLEKWLKEALSVQQQLKKGSQANEIRISEIEKALSTEQQKLNALLIEQQSNFSAAQDKRASEFATNQAEFLAKFTTTVTDHQTQFSSEEDSRRSAFSEFQRLALTNVNEMMSGYDKQLKDHDDEFRKKERLADSQHQEHVLTLHSKYELDAGQVLQEIHKHKSEVESLVGVIGNLGVTSGYKKVADQARGALYFWQTMTVASLLGLIVVAFLIAFPSNPPSRSAVASLSMAQLEKPSPALNNTNTKASETRKVDAISNESVSANISTDSNFYHGLVTRIFLSLTFGIFAAYAGKQASRFFNIEQKNRKLALELEALGPFIEPLCKEDRDKFRVQVGDRSFGVPDHDSTKFKEDDPVSILGFFRSKEFQDMVSEQVKEAAAKLK